MTNVLTTLETDLAAFATPNPAEPTTGGGTATVVDPGPLSAIAALFNALEGASGIGAAIGTLAGGINTGLGDAADVLDQIAEQLESLSTAAGGDATTILTTLTNALSTAGALVPGSAPVTALQSGGAFFQQLESLLSDFPGDVASAATCLFQIAQQLRAIGSLPTSGA
jgi:hypothetical protein